MTEERTRSWLTALAEQDFPTLEALLDPDVTVTMPLTFDGTLAKGPVHVGREAVLGYFHDINKLMPRRELRDLRLTDAGDTVFLQFNGDFTTADGRPYRNAYVFRLDWRDGLLTTIEEYANPIAFANAFPDIVHSVAPGSPSATLPA
jgi:ketosteroid isomerase-like protein